MSAKAKSRKPRAPLEANSYVGSLAAIAQEAASSRKGERTRKKIELATAKVLAERGYHDMRVIDITGEAGISDGAFYVYFKDKREATLSVLHGFVVFMAGDARELDGSAPTAFEAIRRANRKWIEIGRANAGLMRCILQVGDTDKEFASLVQAQNNEWHERVARSVVRRYPAGAVDENAVLFASHALGAMMDEVIRRLVVQLDEALVAVFGKLTPTDDDVVDALSVIWHRVLYPNLAMPGGLKKTASRLAKLDALTPIKA